MTPRELLGEWVHGMQIAIVSHYAASKRFNGLHRAIGFPSIIFSTLTTTAIVSTTAEGGDGLLKGIAIGISLVAQVLAALQTFLENGPLAARHQQAAVELTKLRHEAEQHLSFDAEITQEVCTDLRTRWDELNKSAPTIPDNLYWRAHKACKKTEAEEPAKA